MSNGQVNTVDASNGGHGTASRKPSGKKGKKGRSWPNYDKEEVKRRMRGRWLAYFQHELRLSPEYLCGDYLAGKEGPCPKPTCGGKSRFCVINADEGVLFCRHCFGHGNGDGLSASAWILDKDVVNDFPELLHRAAVYADVSPIGIENGERQSSAVNQALSDRAAMIAAMSPDAFLAAVCSDKRMPVESALAYGAVVRNWGSLGNGGERVVEFLVFDEQGKSDPANRFGLSHFAVDELLHKGKFAKGAKHGLFLPRSDDGGVRLPRPGETWVAVEGVKDAAVLHSLGYNAVGLPTSSMNAKFAPLFAGVDVVLAPDLDHAGEQGADKSAKGLQGVATTVRRAKLPGELRESGGEDVRDVLAKPDGEARLREAIDGAKSATGQVQQIEVISSAEFFSANYRREYLIEGILTAGEPCVIGGQSKTLKTTLAVDLALAIGTGSSFLGCFEVKIQRRVVVLSGESGDFTLQESAKRIANSRKIVHVERAEVYWGFDLPCLGSEEGIEQLMSTIENVEAEVLIVDPAYLSLMGDATRGLNAGNIFDIGPLLLNISRECKSRGLTLILLHHCRKNSPNEKFSPPELAELSMAGFGEFARQWILLGRREAYLCDGKHKLWLVVGGSAGHGGQWALDVDEGDFDAGNHRKYDVALRTAIEEQAAKKTNAEARKTADQVERHRKNQLKVAEVLASRQAGDTASRISAASGINAKYLGPVLHSMLAEGAVEQCIIVKGKREYEGWRLATHRSSSGTSSPPSEAVRQVRQTGLLSECPGDAEVSDNESDRHRDYINSPCLSDISSDTSAANGLQPETNSVGQVRESRPETPAVAHPGPCPKCDCSTYIDTPIPEDGIRRDCGNPQCKHMWGWVRWHGNDLIDRTVEGTS